MKILVSDLKREDVNNKNIDEYIDFIKEVKSNMEHPEWLGDFTKEDVLSIISNGGYCFLYRLGEMVAATSFIIPAREKDIEKFGVNYHYQETMDYGPEAVIDYLRGSGVQSFILKDMDLFCKNLGYKYAVTTVHPDNIYCIHNMEKHGFTYVDTKEFSRGIRNIYQKDI